MKHMLTVQAIPRRFTDTPGKPDRKPAQGGGMKSWASVVAEPEPSGRSHAPLAAATADRAAVMTSVGRLTYSAGWGSKKAITFDSAI